MKCAEPAMQKVSIEYSTTMKLIQQTSFLQERCSYQLYMPLITVTMHRNGFKASFYSSGVPVQGMWLHPCMESCCNRCTWWAHNLIVLVWLVQTYYMKVPSLFNKRNNEVYIKPNNPLDVWVSEANTWPKHSEYS